MALIAALVATLAAGIFAGAAVYVTLVEHPARVSCGPAIAVAEFRPSYSRGAIMQALLAIIGTAAGIGRWAIAGGLGWLVSALVLGAVVPFTLLIILPTNHRLFDDALDEAAVRTSLGRWGRLHAVRSLLGVVGFAGFVTLLTRG